MTSLLALALALFVQSAFAGPLYPDRDGDGFGATPPVAEPGVPWVDNRDDCDDQDPTVYPEAPERWADGFVDNDCDDEVEPIFADLRPLRTRGLEPELPGEDLDGDGIFDRVEADGAEVRVISGRTGRTLARVQQGARARLVGDVDGDGAPDLLVLGAEARFHTRLYEQPIQRPEDARTVVVGGPFTGAVDLGDRDQDGRSETLLLRARLADGGAWLGVLCAHDLAPTVDRRDLLLQALLPEGWGEGLAWSLDGELVVARADGRLAVVPVP